MISLVRGRLSKSSKTICCQVPSIGWPCSIGIASEGPNKEARRCEKPLSSPHRSSWWYLRSEGINFSANSFKSCTRPDSHSIVVRAAVDPETKTVTVPRSIFSVFISSRIFSVISMMSQKPAVFCESFLVWILSTRLISPWAIGKFVGGKLSRRIKTVLDQMKAYVLL